MKNSIVIMMLMSLILVGCKENENSESNDAAEVEAEVVDTPQIKLYVLDGGTIKVNELGVFSQDDTYKGQSRTFADPIFIIEHPKGTLLWDGGLSEAMVGQEPFTTPDGVFTVSRKDSLVNQLKELNMTPTDIEFIGLSHTHFDHSGSAYQLKDATWLVQENEYNFVTSDAIKTNQADMYNGIKDLTKITKINGDHDVFGDGKVIMKFLPGHTPGHQALYVELEEEGPVLLSGDLYHLKESRENRVVPSFNVNVENTLKSMDTFEAFAKSKNARVIIQHSMEDFNSLPKFPNALK